MKLLLRKRNTVAPISDTTTHTWILAVLTIAAFLIVMENRLLDIVVIMLFFGMFGVFYHKKILETREKLVVEVMDLREQYETSMTKISEVIVLFLIDISQMRDEIGRIKEKLELRLLITAEDLDRINYVSEYLKKLEIEIMENGKIAGTEFTDKHYEYLLAQITKLKKENERIKEEIDSTYNTDELRNEIQELKDQQNNHQKKYDEDVYFLKLEFDQIKNQYYQVRTEVILERGENFKTESDIQKINEKINLIEEKITDLESKIELTDHDEERQSEIENLREIVQQLSEKIEKLLRESEKN